MIGLFSWAPPERGKWRKAVEYRETSILHVRFLRVEIRRGPRTMEVSVRRRVQAAARRLGDRGVLRTVLPEEFPYRSLLEPYGVHPVSTLALRRRFAADWVRSSLTRRGISPAGARVAVSAAQMTGEVVRTVTELCLRHRYVLLDLPYGGEELCRQLRREYGVSLLLGPDRGQLSSADALLLFDPRADLGIGPSVLPLYDESSPMVPLILPPALEEQLPPEADRGQMLSALLGAGALRPGQAAIGL